MRVRFSCAGLAGLLVLYALVATIVEASDWDRSYYDTGIGEYRPFFFNGELSDVSATESRAVMHYVPAREALSELRAQHWSSLPSTQGDWLHAEFWVRPDPGVGIAGIVLQAQLDGEFAELNERGVRSHKEGEWRRFVVHHQLEEEVDRVLAMLSLGWEAGDGRHAEGYDISAMRVWKSASHGVAREPEPAVASWLMALEALINQHAIDFDTAKDDAAWQQFELLAAEAAEPADLYRPRWSPARDLFGALDGGHSGIFANDDFGGGAVETDRSFGWTTKRLTPEIGQIVVPAFASVEADAVTAFAKAGQAQLEAINAQASCGMLVDLRDNSGGNMWGMIAALQPLLGTGRVGSFAFRDGHREHWSLSAQAASLDDALMASKPAPTMVTSNKPVAVLFGAGTMSSGEAMVVAFVGRENTRSFGQASAGMSDSMEQFSLPDGAILNLATARYADRSGTVHGRQLRPDVLTDDAEADAVRWLESFCVNE